MQSKAPGVASYLEQLPDEGRIALEKLRQFCRRFLQGYEECMEYGMPAYKRNGVIEVAFASQKQYISLYVLEQDVVDRHHQALAGCRIGKGCIRFPKADRIDFTAVSALLRDTAKSKSAPCRRGGNSVVPDCRPPLRD
jgi:uncharacterized protein YdhG (YjbR/CyaY superfamily)